MGNERPFSELNQWQRIFADHWHEFASLWREANGRDVPDHWRENVERMLTCGDIREGCYEYVCGDL